MPDAKPQSLRQLLLSHELAFLFLVVVTGALGGFWAYFWQQTSAESIRLNGLAHIAQEIRSDLYRQVKEVALARLRDDPDTESVYAAHTKDIKARFNLLRQRSRGRAEAYAIQALQEGYGRLQADMNAIYDDAYLLNRMVRSSLLEPEYERQLLEKFEDAHLNFRGLINRQLDEQAAKLSQWTRFAPILIPVPIIVAILLLLFSRTSLRRGFLQPVQRIVQALRKKDERELRALSCAGGVAEIQEITTAINEMAEALERSRETLVDTERQAALGALVPVVAHNIRNPLASIRASAQLIEAAGPATETDEGKQAIIETVDRLERWVGALVSYLHPLTPNLRLVPATQLFEPTLALLKPRIEDKSLRIDRRPWDDHAQVSVDPDLMEQALYAVVTNAIEASPRGGTITLGVSVAEGKVLLTISDDGGGIAFAPEPTGLEPGPTTKKRGTGLGIPVAFKVCKAHGWELHYAVKDNASTVVTFRAGAAV